MSQNMSSQRHRRITVAAVPALVLATACATPAGWVRPVYPATPGDSAQYAPFLAAGNGTVNGQAFLKTRGGDVKLGAGNAAYLDPVTTYSRAWWAQHAIRAEYFDSLPPDRWFRQAHRRTVVDAQGHFRFSNLAPGWYYVRSLVTWDAPGRYGADPQGGVVRDSILVPAGGAVEVILSEH